MEIITVNRHGQVTLPSRDRKRFGIKPGSTLKVESTRDEIVLKKAKIVDEDVFDKIKRIADEKGITQKDIIKMCRDVGRQVYEEEYGK
ncbi:MAG: AbrB/MazE/SpoVT family DNA-binding domain-containing protein [Candidatus Micrarchaeota archaeon]